MSYISGLDDHQLTSLRGYLLSDFEKFSHFCFKIQTGTKFISVDYHKVMFSSIQRLIDQVCNRMVITIPPRGGKTQIISIFLPLFAWVHNPSSQNILTGFNSDVLHECTGYIRSIMSDPDFRSVFPDVIIDLSKKSVERLGTMSGGVTHAVPTAGKVTGKGCGALVKGFSGLMCIDDIIKPDDCNSPTERDKINNRFSNTLLSRLATESTPLVIIMQRLHLNDLVGHLFKGGTTDVYEWLNIPGIVTKETGTKEWYQEDIDAFGYTNVVPILYDLERPDSAFDENGESSFWKVRKDLSTLNGMKLKDPYTFYSQYLGRPVGKGQTALGIDDIRFYDDVLPHTIRYTFMTADTASTTKSYSSYSVFSYWAVTKVSELLLVDVHIGKWEVPELIPEARSFWRKHNKFDPNAPSMTPRGMHLEDKASGLFLNQQFLRDGTVTVRPVPRDGTPSNDKFSRFLNTLPYFVQGRIMFPRNHEHTQHIVQEVLGQSEFGSTTGYDDFVDTLSDAVNVAFDTKQMSYEEWN